MNKNRLVSNTLHIINFLLFLMIFTVALFILYAEVIVSNDDYKYKSIIEFVNDNTYFKSNISKEEINLMIHNTKDIDTLNKNLLKIDKYSEFYKSSDEFDKYYNRIYTGVGIVIKGNIVKDVYKNSPAYVLGVKKGDKILSINEINIPFDNIENAETAIREIMRNNTTLNLTLLRNNKTFNIKVDKKPIQVESVTSKIENGISLITIKYFNDDTERQFFEVMDMLVKKEVNDIVIDLCNNAGGKIRSAINIAKEFLKKNQTICILKNRDKTINVTTDRDGNYSNLKVTILINELSASASELLAGSLRDNNSAKIYGKKSYGKGMMQGMREINGGLLKYTIGEFCLPKEGCIEGRGIMPDSDINEELKKIL